MFTLAVLAAFSVLQPHLADPPVGIHLEDVYRFGVSPEAAGDMARLATNHPAVMRAVVQSHNDLLVVGHWEREVAWRAECWGLLRIAVDEQVARTQAFCQIGCCEDRNPTDDEVLAVRLDALDSLRALIGEADYHAGRMPKPTPDTYRIPERGR